MLYLPPNDHFSYKICSTLPSSLSSSMLLINRRCIPWKSNVMRRCNKRNTFTTNNNCLGAKGEGSYMMIHAMLNESIALSILRWYKVMRHSLARARVVRLFGSQRWRIVDDDTCSAKWIYCFIYSSMVQGHGKYDTSQSCWSERREADVRLWAGYFCACLRFGFRSAC